MSGKYKLFEHVLFVYISDSVCDALILFIRCVELSKITAHKNSFALSYQIKCYDLKWNTKEQTWCSFVYQLDFIPQETI